MMRAGFGHVEVQQKQAATRFQHAPDFAQSAGFLIGLEMMEHEGRDYEVEGSIGVFDLVTKSLLETDFCARSLGFLTRASKRLGISIQSCDFNSWMQLLEQN